MSRLKVERSVTDAGLGVGWVVLDLDGEVVADVPDWDDALMIAIGLAVGSVQGRSL